MYRYVPSVLEFDGMLFCPSQCVKNTCGRQTIAKINSYHRTYRIRDESAQIKRTCALYREP